MELLVVVAVIGVLASIILTSLGKARLKARNASIVASVSNIDVMLDLDKYPGSLEDVCFDFEPGGEFEQLRVSTENAGGIWHCDSTEDAFRVYVKLNQDVVVAQNIFARSVFAQEGSSTHSFGNYYCVNSDFKKNFTHWPGDSLAYPSCDDADYITTPIDPEPDPEPTTPDPDPDPEPPVENGGSSCSGNKVEVCHFENTLCVSSSALNAHTNHGDIEGSC